MITFVTTVVGKINGVDFRAEGQGECAEPGRAQGELHFNTRIPDFTAMLCKSWKCKQHTPIARMALSEPNPLADFLDSGGRIIEHTDIEYPNVEDHIQVTSICERPEDGLQTVYQTRIGHYTGRIDITEQLPFNLEITPQGPGKASGYSVRQLVLAGGSRMKILYRDKIRFSDRFELPYPMTVEISGEVSHQEDGMHYFFDTEAIARRSTIYSVTPS